jgi:hypothetical protein
MRQAFYRILAAAVVAAVTLAGVALAQTTDPRTITRGSATISGQRVAAGFEQLTLSSGTAAGLASIPTAKGGIAVTLAVITIEGNGVRFRDDGVAPTAAIGWPLGVGANYIYTGDPANLQFIRQSATNATVNVLYYY